MNSHPSCEKRSAIKQNNGQCALIYFIILSTYSYGECESHNPERLVLFLHE